MEFSLGKMVRHKYTKELLWMLRKGNEQILCRTRDLREIWFYLSELEEVSEICENINSTTSRFL